MSIFGNTNATGGGGGNFFTGFNNANPSGTAGTSIPPTNIFGAAPVTPNPLGGTTTSTPQMGGTGNLFSATSASGTSAIPTTAATGGNGLFSMQNTLKPAPTFTGGSNVFGGTGATSTPASGIGSSTANSTTASAPAAPGGFFTTTSTPTAKPGGLFNTAPSASTPTANPLFNAASTSTPAANPLAGGFFAAANASAPNTDATKPAAPAAPATNSIFGAKSNLFGQPASTSNTGAAPATTIPSLGSFTLPPKPATTGPTTGTTAGPSLFTNPVLPKTGAETANKDTPAPTTTGTSFSSPFSLFNAAAKPTEKKSETASPSTDKKDAPASTTATTATNATTTGSAAPTVSVAIAPPSMLKAKSLEEIVNRWTSDLEAHIKEFNKFAGEVSVWDRALIENGNNIAALNSHILAAERQQEEINETLGHIEQQQKDLASTLDAYEKISQDILGGQSGSLRTLDTGPADSERDKNYVLATDLHTHLDDLSGSLTQMIDSVNALSISSKPADSADDPMSQISQILSSHLESLQWIDTAVREVENKTKEVENLMRDSGHSNFGGSKSRGFGVNR